MSKREIGAIENARVRLRLLIETDLALTLRWRNQDHIRRWFFHPDPITPEQHRRWFEQYRERDDDFVFVIEELPARRPVGQVALYHLDWNTSRAEFGRLMIGEPDAAGKGLARAATELTLQITFARLGLRQVYLEVFADNVRARAIYDSCGFQITAQRDNVLTMLRTDGAN